MKKGSDVGRVSLCVGIDAHRQIGVRPASSFGRSYGVNTLPDHQFGKEPMPSSWMR